MIIKVPADKFKIDDYDYNSYVRSLVIHDKIILFIRLCYH